MIKIRVFAIGLIIAAILGFGLVTTYLKMLLSAKGYAFMFALNATIPHNSVLTGYQLIMTFVYVCYCLGAGLLISVLLQQSAVEMASIFKSRARKSMDVGI